MTAPDLQPTLTGSLTELRPIRTEDWDEMFAAASDPLIWEVHPSSERYKEPLFRKYFDEALQCGSAFTFRRRDTGAVIGSSRYHGLDPALSEIEIGWTFLMRSVWGGAYNREIKDLMLRHAFGFVETVVFKVGETNVRSRRAMEKIGGKLRKDMIVQRHQGIDFPYVIYEIAKQDWEG